MSTSAKEVKEQAATVIANAAAPVTEVPVIPTVQTKPQATASEITAFIVSKLPAPTQITEQIDTSDIDLSLYRDDNDINAVYDKQKNGWDRIQLVAPDKDGNDIIIPHARLKIIHSSGNSYKVPPFFFAVLLARQSTIQLEKESQLKAWSEQGSMKVRNSFRFVASKEQLDALHAKSQLQWEIACRELAERFTNWLGSYHPTVDLLDTLYSAFNAGTVLVPLEPNQIYIRQTIGSKDTTSLLELDNLTLVTTNEDKIGDSLISTCYTYLLQMA